VETRIVSKVAAIYDIHGNLPALDAVLREIDRHDVDLVIVGGDAAAGPMPRPTIDRLMELGDRADFVRGNADRLLVEHFDGLSQDSGDDDVWFLRDRWAAAQITKHQRDFLDGFSGSMALEIEGLSSTLFCHGSPRSDEEIITAKTPGPRLRGALAGVDQRLVVCGHTHMQFDRSWGDFRIVNAGSVGMPYEGRPGAYWALLGPEVKLRRSDYDYEEAAELFSASGFPGVDDVIESVFSRPPLPDETTEMFERRAEERG
jgi:predicted phosphodiesterase